MKRYLGIWMLVVLAGILSETGYFRWWAAILVTPLPLALAFALCRRRWTCALLGLFGGFVVMRLHLNGLTVFDHSATIVLSFLKALTLVPVALVVQDGVRRGYRLAWVLPVAWVGAEVLRITGPTGLPFTVLGFACREQTWMIQVADLGGPLLLSFAIAAISGVVLDGLCAQGSARERLRRAMVPGGFVVCAAWLALFAYGQVRMRQIDASLEPGPRIAVVQSDAILFQNPEKDFDSRLLLRELMNLSEQAATDPRPPDLIVWPENAANIPLFNEEFLNAEFDPRMVPEASRSEATVDPEPFARQWEAFRRERRHQQDAFQRWVGELGIPILAGLPHQSPGGGAFPNYFEVRNAATLFTPEGESPSASQFKIRLFPGAETLPGGVGAWKNALGWLPPVRRWLETVSGLVAGEERVLMRVDGHPLVVSICSEILFSENAGVFAESPDGGKPVIITLANEGILQRNHSILMLKMAMPFRAVEARTTVARSANAGVSGFADPAGRYQDLVTNEDGRYFTRMGTPESAAIDAVIEFRRQHGAEAIARDAALLDEHRRLVDEVERLRALAGIRGFSIRDTHTTPQRTVYQRGGHYFPYAVLAAFVILTGGVFFLPRRDAVR